MKFYDFVPKGIKLNEATPKDFFIFWSPFCKDFKDIWKREQQKLIKEKMKEAKKKQEEKINKVQKMKKGEGGLVRLFLNFLCRLMNNFGFFICRKRN